METIHFVLFRYTGSGCEPDQYLNLKKITGSVHDFQEKSRFVVKKKPGSGP